jgi:hypothetical protein
MKVIVWLLVLVGAGWAGVYYLGGYGSFDPSEQGRQNREKIQAGMPYTQVFDEITGNPRKYRIINMRKEHGVEYLAPSAEVNFDRARVDDHMRDNTLPHGFTATFTYSSSEAFTVTFDGKGNLVSLSDAMTSADMFQMPKKQGRVIEPGLEQVIGEDGEGDDEGQDADAEQDAEGEEDGGDEEGDGEGGR